MPHNYGMDKFKGTKGEYAKETAKEKPKVPKKGKRGKKK